MSTALREAAQQILVAWDNDDSGTMDHPLSAAIEALRATLEQQDEPKGGGNLPPPLQAEPVQEPVAWLQPKTVDAYLRPDLGYETCSKDDYGAFPVHTHPPRREWQGLTDEEINDGRNQLPTEDLCGWSFRQGAYFAETRLKEKNA
jgi:hypothetical protein